MASASVRFQVKGEANKLWLGLSGLRIAWETGSKDLPSPSAKITNVELVTPLGRRGAGSRVEPLDVKTLGELVTALKLTDKPFGYYSVDEEIHL